MHLQDTTTSLKIFLISTLCFYKNKNHHTYFNHPPPPQQNPFIALNTNSSVQDNPGFAGRGGVLKDSQRNWINGLSMHIDFDTNNAAKL